MGDRRRDSITNATDQFQIMLEQQFIKLRKIWDRVGLQEDQREERMDIALGHLTKLIHDMLNEEEEMEQVLVRNVKNYSAQLLEFCNELGLEMPAPDSKWSLMDTETHVIAALKDVKQQRDAVMMELNGLKARDALVSDRLDIVRFPVSGEVVPSSATLDALRKHLDAATTEFEKRHAVYVNAKKEMERMLKSIGRAPRTTIERQIAQLNDDEFILSKENMDALKAGLKSLGEEHKEHVRHLHTRIGVLRGKLMALWDKCCFNQAERDLFEAFFTETITEEVFAAHREEIDRLMHYYEENKENLSQVNAWEDLFAKLKDFEARGNDSDRYKNRGGALLREERERLDVERRFPKVTEMLKKESANWGNFKVYGLRVPDFIEACLERRRLDKEAERLLKLKQRQEQLEVERKFGAKPVTPVKGLRIRTPTKTPTVCHGTNGTRNETGISQASSSTGVRCNSRQFVHSSIAMTQSRSPFTSVGNKTPTMTSATGRGNNFSTCVKRPAPSSIAELAQCRSEPRRARVVDLDDTLRPTTTVTSSPSKHLLPANLVNNANASIMSSNLSYDHFAMPLHNSDAADNKHSSILLAPSTANKRRK